MLHELSIVKVYDETGNNPPFAFTLVERGEALALRDRVDAIEAVSVPESYEVVDRNQNVRLIFDA